MDAFWRLLGHSRCPRCGDWLVTRSRTPNTGSGCIIAILGLCLAPVLIGLPIIAYGVYLWSQTETWQACARCGG